VLLLGSRSSRGGYLPSGANLVPVWRSHHWSGLMVVPTAGFSATKVRRYEALQTLPRRRCPVVTAVIVWLLSVRLEPFRYFQIAEWRSSHGRWPG